MTMIDKLKKYVEEFNLQDEELYCEDIKNCDAFKWMKEHIPYFDCPDKEIEKTYYYRWWTYRKHIKSTPDGYIITEFMPDVPWAGKYNSINAPIGHQLAEGRWIRDKEGYISDTIKFWLNQKGDSFAYSTWLISAIMDYCKIKGDYSIAIDNLDKICKYYEKWEASHLCENGMFWSIDDRDAMEFSISGTGTDLKPLKGFRPTLNSYMAADAEAIAEIAKLSGKSDIENQYRAKADKLRKLILDNLWNGEFFKAIHCEDENGNPVLGSMPREQNVRELIGYIPWAFNIPTEGMEGAFKHLKNRNGFLCDYGFTTAEQSHPRYLYEADHECLWNGYVWPYATSQVINAMSNLIRNYSQNVITKNGLYNAILTYAKQHKRTADNGKEIMWIDEVLDPVDGSWYSRDWLENAGFLPELGGKERGKDYNHSTYCDLILSCLLGISSDNTGKPEVKPLIPDSWDYFRVENIELGGKLYNISYTKENGIVIE